MPKIKIKSDEILFNTFHILSARVKNLSSIVQNDMEVEKAEMDKFMGKEWEEVIKDLTTLRINVLKHIVKCNE